MQLIRWTDGGFGMAAHNYDGDMLTDQIAQVHRSPGFITSNLVGKNDDGSLIKEFEASHGTVSDLWHDHLAGKETSLNPLGLVEAIIGAMQHAATLDADQFPDDAEKKVTKAKIFNFTTILREAMHNTFRYGQGTRDMSGPSGFTTEDYIAKVAWRLERYLSMSDEEVPPPQLHEPDRKLRRNFSVDVEAVNKMFLQYDKNGDGQIDYQEFESMMVKLNLAPKIKNKEAFKPDN
jgi:isocitrate dehydrogenase